MTQADNLPTHMIVGKYDGCVIPRKIPIVSAHATFIYCGSAET